MAYNNCPSLLQREGWMHLSLKRNSFKTHEEVSMSLEGVTNAAYTVKNFALEKGSQLVQGGKELGSAFLSLAKKVVLIALNALNTLKNYAGNWGGAAFKTINANRALAGAGVAGLILGGGSVYLAMRNRNKPADPAPQPPSTGQEGPQLVEEA